MKKNFIFIEQRICFYVKIVQLKWNKMIFLNLLN